MIDTLPFVWHVVVPFVCSQFGRALAGDAVMSAVTANPAINIAGVR
ncbi:MAG: hypothetical protein AB7G47_13120 [Mycolicibacterium sp.]